MPKIIKTASVQMDANPAPTSERLDRAERIVIQAAQAGAQLVVLPELFNTGYAYTNDNYQLAEPIDGMTGSWIKRTATRLGIYLAGSLMLLEHGEIYNALLLFDPTGQMWRYDKNYPWAWERGYFRERHGITIAHTDLGDIGMLICWDAAHRNLWRQYAGQIDMMIISSCPPDGSRPTYHFPDGRRLTMDDFGPVMATLKGSGERVFGDMINQQTAWLGVPSVCSVGSGEIRTAIPRGFAWLLIYAALAPWNLKYLPQAGKTQMSCQMIPGTKIVGANGQVLAERTQSQGEGFTMAEMALADEKPSPRFSQPTTLMGWLGYLSADILAPFLMRPVYKRGIQSVSRKTIAD